MDYEELFQKCVNRKPVTAAPLPPGRYPCVVAGGKVGVDGKGKPVFKLRLQPNKFPNHTLFKDVPLNSDEAKVAAMVRIFEKAISEQYHVIATVSQYKVKGTQRIINLVGDIAVDKQVEADGFDDEDFDTEVPF